VHAVDTSVLARLFVRDEAGQTADARRAIAAESIFVPKTVMIELEWVLRSSYGQPRATIVAALEIILATANMEVEDAAAVARAIAWFRRGMDFADALHLASSGHADRFLTFDVSMRRRASSLGARPPVVRP
jgi:predicted nucleic-acid-binding protein